jgi:hypothetical protein
MWQILSYVFLIVSLGCYVYSEVARTASARKGFRLLFILFWAAASIASYPSDSITALVALYCFGLFLSEFIIRPLLRRRVIPPCVRVKDFVRHNVTLTITKIIVVVGFILLIIMAFHDRRFLEFVGPIPAVLWLISVCGFFILALCERTEICANGLWRHGRFHEWGDYKFYRVEAKEGDMIVEFRLSDKSPTLLDRSKRIVVPPENWEAAKRLLEANLLDLSPIAIND